MKKLLLGAALAAAFSSPVYADVDPDREIHWLALNIYHEARNQPIVGQIAVAMVTLNRVNDSKFPNTIEQVVTQGTGKRHKCQFSWYCDGKKDTPLDVNAWAKAEGLAYTYYRTWVQNRLFDITEGALFYHAAWMKKFPKWVKSMSKPIRIHDHLFYKKK